MSVRMELRGLEREFSDGTRVGPVDLVVDRGELVTLLGPSGSGKTTTLRMIAGFIRPQEGSLLFNGENVLTVPPRDRGIGMVFQSIALFPNMTVFQNIAFGLDMARWKHEDVVARVEEMSDMLRIRGLLHRHINEISGGEAQRVALARALAKQPRVLLLDEPLSSLDPQLREHLQMEIRRVQRSLAITTIYVTHDQTEAFAVSDRVAIMNEGKVVQIGPPEELYESPRNEFVARFLGSGNVFSGSVEEVHERTILVRVNEHQFEVHGQEQVGARVCFTVKPEDVVVARTVSSDAHPATVLSVIHQIGSHRLVLDLDGTQVVSLLTDSELVRQLSEPLGQRVALRFDPESAALVEPCNG
jgi:ABC-type Fe3+/spermidine/putrescine transport system ATPase subunit